MLDNVADDGNRNHKQAVSKVLDTHVAEPNMSILYYNNQNEEEDETTWEVPSVINTIFMKNLTIRWSNLFYLYITSFVY